MIRVVQRDLTANERRRLRSSSSMEEPILSVAPDSRRACDLRRQQLDAMGIAVNELRGRVDHTEHARWWRAWTSAPDVRSLTVLAPHVADPDALGLLLLDADQRLEAVTVVAPTRLPSRHKLLLERLAEDWTTPSGWTEASPTVAVQTREPAPDLPPVPRVNTLSLLAVSAEAHSTADHQRLADRLREHTTTFDAAADQGPEAVLAQLQRAGAGAASDDELLLVLHGLAAAGWRRGG